MRKGEIVSFFIWNIECKLFFFVLIFELFKLEFN